MIAQLRSEMEDTDHRIVERFRKALDDEHATIHEALGAVREELTAEREARQEAVVSHACLPTCLPACLRSDSVHPPLRASQVSRL
jgi:hypothetical protein